MEPNPQPPQIVGSLPRAAKWARGLYLAQLLGNAWRHTRRFGRGNFWWTLVAAGPTVLAFLWLNPNRKDMGLVVESVAAGVLAAFGAVVIVLLSNLVMAPARMQRMADRRLRNSRAVNARLSAENVAYKAVATRPYPGPSGVTINQTIVGEAASQIAADQVANLLRVTETRTESGIILPSSVSLLPQQLPEHGPEGGASP